MVARAVTLQGHKLEFFKYNNFCRKISLFAFLNELTSGKGFEYEPEARQGIKIGWILVTQLVLILVD